MRERLAAAPVAAHDHVAARGHRLHGELVQRHRTLGPLALDEVEDDPLGAREDEGRGKHREERRAQDHLRGRFRQRAVALREREENEAEFARGSEREGSPKGRGLGDAEHPRQHEDHEELAGEQEHEERQHRREGAW